MTVTYFRRVREIAFNLQVLGGVFPFWVSWRGGRDKKTGRATRKGTVVIGVKDKKEPLFVFAGTGFPRAEFFKMIGGLGMWEVPRTPAMRKGLCRRWQSWRLSRRQQGKK